MDNPIDNFDRFERIADLLAGESSSEEQKELNSWLREKPENEVLFKKVKKVWQASEVNVHNFEPDSSAAWKKVNPVANKKKAPHFHNHTRKNIRGWSGYYYIAASVVLVACLGFIWQVVQENHIIQKLSLEKEQVEVHEKSEVVLADGSRVWINSNSHLYYPKTFEKERIVYLEGEAYFEIEKDEKPFKIITGNGVAEVLGTSFNINSRGEAVVVTVAGGQVALYAEDDKNDRVILAKGERGRYDIHSGKVTKAVNSDINFLSWRTGLLVFKNSSLATVVEDVGRHYQEKIITDGSASKQCMLTSTFKDKSLDEVLDLIALTLNVEVHHEKDQIVIVGKGC